MCQKFPFNPDLLPSLLVLACDHLDNLEHGKISTKEIGFTMLKIISVILLFALAFDIGRWIGLIFAALVVVTYLYYSERNKMPGIEYSIGKITKRLEYGKPLPYQMSRMRNRLNEILSPIQPRRSSESTADYEGRLSYERKYGWVNDFEVEIVTGLLNFPNQQNVEAELHRILNYPKKNYVVTHRPAELIETKIKNFHDGPMINKAEETSICVRCTSNILYPASLMFDKYYYTSNLFITACGVKFYQIEDESGEYYFYPNSLFSSLRVENDISKN